MVHVPVVLICFLAIKGLLYLYSRVALCVYHTYIYIYIYVRMSGGDIPPRLRRGP